MGFDYFYGFVGGDTSQWQPGNLFRNTTPDPPLSSAQSGLEPDHRDGRRRHRPISAPTPRSRRTRPWFIHYAPGGTHAPHHPTREWVQRIEAMNLFDDG